MLQVLVKVSSFLTLVVKFMFFNLFRLQNFERENIRFHTVLIATALFQNGPFISEWLCNDGHQRRRMHTGQVWYNVSPVLDTCLLSIIIACCVLVYFDLCNKNYAIFIVPIVIERIWLCHCNSVGLQPVLTDCTAGATSHHVHRPPFCTWARWRFLYLCSPAYTEAYLLSGVANGTLSPQRGQILLIS